MLLDRLSALQPLLVQMDVVSNALTTVLEESQNYSTVQYSTVQYSTVQYSRLRSINILPSLFSRACKNVIILFSVPYIFLFRRCMGFVFVF